MFDTLLEVRAANSIGLSSTNGINYFGDDQNAFTQFALANPHVVSVDTQKKMFYSLYKEETEFLVWVEADYTIHFNSYRSEKTAAIHCNGGTKKICSV